MKWLEPFYCGDIDSTVLDRIKKEAESYDPKEYGEYKLVILALNPKNMLEILSIRQLAINYYQNCDFKVVGVAKDKPDAENMICNIIKDVFDQQGDYDIRKFYS